MDYALYALKTMRKTGQPKATLLRQRGYFREGNASKGVLVLAPYGRDDVEALLPIMRSPRTLDMVFLHHKGYFREGFRTKCIPLLAHYGRDEVEESLRMNLTLRPTEGDFASPKGLHAR